MGTRGVRRLAWLACVLCAFATLYCVYSARAVPIAPTPTAAQLARAHESVLVWLALGGLSFVACFIAFVIAASLARRKIPVGFDVVPRA